MQPPGYSQVATPGAFMKLTIATVLVFMLSNMPAPLYALWEQTLHFDAATTSMLFSMYQAGVLIGLLLLGLIVDKLGWRTSLSAAALLMAAGSTAFALAVDPMWLGAGRLVSGICIGVFLSCGAAAITASRAVMGKSDGPAVATLAVSSGLCLGPLSAGVLVGLGAATVPLLFLGQAALLLVASVLAWLSVPTKSKAAVPSSPSVSRDRPIR